MSKYTLVQKKGYVGVYAGGEMMVLIDEDSRLAKNYKSAMDYCQAVFK